MNFISFPQLTTERLLLRKIVKEDADRVLFLRSDASITKYIQRKKPENIEDALAFITKITGQMNTGESVTWGIELIGKTTIIGSICLWNFSENRKTAEVGYELDPNYQQKGIMSEALQRVLNFGFNDLHLHKIEAFTHRNNVNSKKLLTHHHFQWKQHRLDKDNTNNLIFEIKEHNYNQSNLNR